MKSITSINQLLETLSITSQEELKNIYKRLNIPLKEFEPYVFWSEENYTRNCIVRTDKYELLLLCWEKNQCTPIHSHNEQECWVYNLKGGFDEIRYGLNSQHKLIEKLNFKLDERQFSYMNNQLGFHLLKAKEQTISLHLYALPIDECLVFNNETAAFETCFLTYHSKEGKLIV